MVLRTHLIYWTLFCLINFFKNECFSLDNWNGLGDKFWPPTHNLRGWIRQAGGEVILYIIKFFCHASHVSTSIAEPEP
jgi:hypothetical protein